MTSGHPEGLPELFLDRSLGRRQVPDLLRAAGLRLHTLAEVYGVPADENVKDVEWLARAGDMAHQYLAILRDLTDACRQPGPFLYAVSSTGLRRVDLTY